MYVCMDSCSMYLHLCVWVCERMYACTHLSGPTPVCLHYSNDVVVQRCIWF